MIVFNNRTVVFTKISISITSTKLSQMNNYIKINMHNVSNLVVRRFFS